MIIAQHRIKLDAVGGAQGQATDIDIQAREILYIRERLNNLYVEHTGQPLKKIAPLPRVPERGGSSQKWRAARAATGVAGIPQKP